MQLDGYNYMLVLGEKEKNDFTVNVRERGNGVPLGVMTIEEFYEFLDKQKPAESQLVQS